MPDQASHPISTSRPFDHQALLDLLDSPALSHPTLRIQSLGTSVLGRTLPCIAIGQGRREVLYVGAHHGMEGITSALLCRFLLDLCRLSSAGVRIGRVPAPLFWETHTLYILPMLNPDGVDYHLRGPDPSHPLYPRLLEMNGGNTDFSAWQANARGVDLNHNYDAGFSVYKRMELSSGILGGAPSKFSGEAPESEPETALLCDWIRFHSSLLGVMTLHTQGREIYYRSGGITPPGAPIVARRLSSLTGYTLADPEGSAAYGGLTDWCIQKKGLPAFTLECGRGTNPLPPESLDSLYFELREALLTFPMLL